MPQVRINLIKGRSKVEKLAVSQVVHQAMVKHLGVPATDANHRIVEFEPEDWIVPEGRSEKFVLIEMTLFAGRTKEAKGAFYADVTAALGAQGVPGIDARRAWRAARKTIRSPAKVNRSRVLQKAWSRRPSGAT